jgi:hypothetical protein
MYMHSVFGELESGSVFINTTSSKNPAIAEALNAVSCACGYAPALLIHVFREARNISGDCTDPMGLPRRKTPVLIIKL